MASSYIDGTCILVWDDLRDSNWAIYWLYSHRLVLQEKDGDTPSSAKHLRFDIMVTEANYDCIQILRIAKVGWTHL